MDVNTWALALATVGLSAIFGYLGGLAVAQRHANQAAKKRRAALTTALRHELEAAGLRPVPNEEDRAQFISTVHFATLPELLQDPAVVDSELLQPLVDLATFAAAYNDWVLVSNGMQPTATVAQRKELDGFTAAHLDRLAAAREAVLGELDQFARR